MKHLRIITRVLLAFVALYIVLSVSFYFFHDKIIFQPDKLARDYTFQFDIPYEEYFIPVDPGIEVNALLFRTSQEPKGLVLYFHGNKDNLQRWGNYATDFTTLGYDVLMTDYRGYGKSGGKPNEPDCYRDAHKVYDWVKSNHSYGGIAIVGRSLGSAVASELAMSANPDVLILETPFDELWGVVYPVFRPSLYFVSPRQQFSNANHLSGVRARIIVIHGTDDWVVPLSSAERLKPLLKPDDRFLVIEGAGHNNLSAFEAYHREIAWALK